MLSDLNNSNNDKVIENIENIEDNNIVNLDLYKIYFNDLLDGEKFIKKNKLIEVINLRGILTDDTRLKNSIELLDENITLDKFIDLINTNILLFKKIFENDLIISNWSKFINDIDNIYQKTHNYNMGKVASYIPQLENVNCNLYSISICSIDGQIYNKGDYKKEFCVQSCSKPITYLIASDLKNSDYVHNFVGHEPSGRNFNELCLNSDKIPHNPLINSGAIMCASLIDYENTLANRYDTVIKYWSRLAGNTKINFSTSVYLSEKDTADRNNCLAYMMQESKAFECGINSSKYKRNWTNKNLEETLDFYFQCCSIEINCTQASVIASTLANDGICPVTNERIFSNTIVKNALSLMSSCGMYDYSGEWAYTIGIPAKSGVSGIIMGIIPNVMGVAVYSPRLDDLGNSSKGIEFFKILTKIYPFHTYDNLCNKNNLLLKKDILNNNINIYNLLTAASIGDLNTIIILYSQGLDLNSYDYDKRTALHLACSECHLKVVEFLIKKTVVIDCVDRWNNKPIDDILKLKNILNDSIVSKKKKNDCEKIIELLRNKTTIITTM
jgi:glutaminase